PYKRPAASAKARGKTKRPKTLVVPAPAAESKPKPGQDSLSKRLRLEQEAASIVGGATGLLMLLDVMQLDVENRDAKSFYFHADAYVQRLERLRALVEQYEKTGPSGGELRRYRDLLDTGRSLKALPAPEGITAELMNGWREDAVRWLDRYNGQEE
ncbi:MAG: hypothetical protein K2O18_05870, partial [Oscillospiraceae bacterium]|nr:hypothetical protein [Oscillospiraceae bacterium]